LKKVLVKGKKEWEKCIADQMKMKLEVLDIKDSTFNLNKPYKCEEIFKDLVMIKHPYIKQVKHGTYFDKSSRKLVRNNGFDIYYLVFNFTKRRLQKLKITAQMTKIDQIHRGTIPTLTKMTANLITGLYNTQLLKTSYKFSKKSKKKPKTESKVPLGDHCIVGGLVMSSPFASLNPYLRGVQQTQSKDGKYQIWNKSGNWSNSRGAKDEHYNYYFFNFQGRYNQSSGDKFDPEFGLDFKELKNRVYFRNIGANVIYGFEIGKKVKVMINEKYKKVGLFEVDEDGLGFSLRYIDFDQIFGAIGKK
jgi:hypothetical protein